MLLQNQFLGGTTGPTLLILHANSLCGAVYQPMVDAVLARHFRCIALDMPGQGDSEPIDPDVITSEWIVSSVLETVEHLGLHGCHVFGHSLGAATALKAEAQQTGIFTAIYVFEAPVMTMKNAGPILSQEAAEGVKPAGHVLASLSRKRKWNWPSRQEARRALGSKPPFNAWNSQAMKAFIEHGLKALDAPKGHSHPPSPLAHNMHSDGHSSQSSHSILSPSATQHHESHKRSAQSQHQEGVQHHENDGGLAGPVQLCCAPEVETAVYLACEPPPSFDSQAVQCPVAWAITSSDPGLHSRLPKLGRSGVQELPNACLREFPHLSHFGPLECPLEVAKDALAFFKSVRNNEALTNAVITCKPDGLVARQTQHASQHVASKL